MLSPASLHLACNHYSALAVICHCMLPIETNNLKSRKERSKKKNICRKRKLSHGFRVVAVLCQLLVVGPYQLVLILWFAFFTFLLYVRGNLVTFSFHGSLHLSVHNIFIPFSDNVISQHKNFELSVIR